MNIEKRKYQGGFGIFEIIILIVAVAIIVVTVLAATGVIDLPRFGSGSSSCEKMRQSCEDSCGNDPGCKKQCFIDYQSCKMIYEPER